MAKALKFHAVVIGKTLPLPVLSAFEGKRVEVIVVEAEASEIAVNLPSFAPRASGALVSHPTGG